ncbi:MAG: hypothetical protein HQL50_02295 [Magnetococcales bacterium]|nr:hypothetical protein [Magnetococcales bacterium]
MSTICLNEQQSIFIIKTLVLDLIHKNRTMAEQVAPVFRWYDALPELNGSKLVQTRCEQCRPDICFRYGRLQKVVEALRRAQSIHDLHGVMELCSYNKLYVQENGCSFERLCDQ